MRDEKPNVIVVLTDDQGYGDLSCHGNPILQTPNLDRLHGQSLRLTDFHVAPVCTPTRSQLLSGCDALRNGATFVCMGRSLLDPSLPTMGDVFAANGYNAGHFGKWHLGDNYPYRPQDRGFAETVHHPAWGITSAADYFGNDYFDDHYRHNGAIEPYSGYCTDVWFDEAMVWMAACQERDEPFFAYVATNAPHVPLWVPDAYRQPYIGKVDSDVAGFYGMIANIDGNMGRLEEFLCQRNLGENTILMFMGDNGTATADQVYNAGMRGKKASLYEGGHRVPCFVRWPAGGLGPARDVEPLSQCQDMLPTLIDLCALEKPAVAFDGVSLAPLWRGEVEALAERILVVQYGHPLPSGWGATGKGKAAVLWDKWRLVDGTELYDVAQDPAQEHDIAAEHPEVVATMAAHYEQWWAELGANLHQYHRIRVGSPQENPARLSSCDWAEVYCDNPTGVRGCVMDSGVWHLQVEVSGTYQIALSRWPREADLAISAPAPVLQGVDGSLPAGKALPVVGAWIEIGDQVVEAPVAAHSRAAVFELELAEGPTTLQTWWLDGAGEQLAGAYYAAVRRVA